MLRVMSYLYIYIHTYVNVHIFACANRYKYMLYVLEKGLECVRETVNVDSRYLLLRSGIRRVRDTLIFYFKCYIFECFYMCKYYLYHFEKQ